MAVLHWADRHMGPKLMGPIAARNIVTAAARADASATLNWIEERSGLWTPRQEAAIFPAVAQAMQAQAPEQFSAWLDAHPEHPQRDQMVNAIAQQFAQAGDYVQARRWSKRIRDTETRAATKKLLQQPEPAGAVR
jgi:hypothetical protein